MTANAMESDRQACLEAGMVDHIGKPFELDQLVALLRHWVGVEVLPEQAAQVRPKGLAPAAPAAPAASPNATAPVLDLDAALARMGRQHDLYKQVAQRVVADLPRYAQAVRGWLAAAQPPPQAEAVRELHTLKGLAATVGAQALAQAAARAEAAFVEAQPGAGQRQAVAEPSLAALLDALDGAAAALQQALTQPALATAPQQTPLQPPAANAQSDPALQQTLQRLRHCLLAFDMQALDLAQQLAPQYAGALGERLPLLLQAVQNLDFAAALAVCDAYLDENPC